MRLVPIQLRLQRPVPVAAQGSRATLESLPNDGATRHCVLEDPAATPPLSRMILSASGEPRNEINFRAAGDGAFLVTACSRTLRHRCPSPWPRPTRRRHRARRAEGGGFPSRIAQVWKRQGVRDLLSNLDVVLVRRCNRHIGSLGHLRPT